MLIVPHDLLHVSQHTVSMRPEVHVPDELDYLTVDVALLLECVTGTTPFAFSLCVGYARFEAHGLVQRIESSWALKQLSAVRIPGVASVSASCNKDIDDLLWVADRTIFWQILHAKLGLCSTRTIPTCNCV